MQEHIKYLESLIPDNIDINKLYFSNFSKYSRYHGNNVYGWMDIFSTNPRELFLMGCLKKLNIKFEENVEE